MLVETPKFDDVNIHNINFLTINHIPADKIYPEEFHFIIKMVNGDKEVSVYPTSEKAEKAKEDFKKKVNKAFWDITGGFHD